MRRRDFLAAAAGVAAVVANPASALAATEQRPGAAGLPDLNLGDFPVVARVRARKALEHLKVLSDRIGPRIGGTESEHRARDYLVRELRSLRYQVSTQPFTVPDKYLAKIGQWQAGASRFGSLGVTVKAPFVEVVDGQLPDLTGKIAFYVNAPVGSAHVHESGALRRRGHAGRPHRRSAVRPHVRGEGRCRTADWLCVPGLVRPDERT